MIKHDFKVGDKVMKITKMFGHYRSCITGEVLQVLKSKVSVIWDNGEVSEYKSKLQMTHGFEKYDPSEYHRALRAIRLAIAFNRASEAVDKVVHNVISSNHSLGVDLDDVRELTKELDTLRLHAYEMFTREVSE